MAACKVLFFLFFIFSPFCAFAENCGFAVQPGMDYPAAAVSAAKCAAEQVYQLAEHNKIIKKTGKDGFIAVFEQGNYKFSGDALSENLFIPSWDRFSSQFVSSLKKRKDFVLKGREKESLEKKYAKNGRKTAFFLLEYEVKSAYKGKKNEKIVYSVKIHLKDGKNRNILNAKASFEAKNELAALANYHFLYPSRTEKNYFAALANPKPKLEYAKKNGIAANVSAIPLLPVKAAPSLEDSDPLTYQNISADKLFPEECIDSSKECDRNRLYQKGIARYSEGKFVQALRIFTVLGGYADSQDYKISSFYNYAAQLFNEGKYEESLRLYSQIKNYASSQDRIILLKYNVGLKKLYSNPPDFENAIFYLSQVEGFKNSGIYLDEAKTLKYNYAAKLNKNKKYAEAERLFKELGRYKDSPARAKEAFYNSAKYEYIGKKYDSALEKFRKIGKYGESKAFVNEILDIKYNAAVKLYNEKKYEAAAAEFAKIAGHRDSKICENYSYYAQAITYLRVKKYEEALPLLKKIKSFGESKKYYADIINLKSLGPYEEGSILEFGSYMGSPIQWKVMRKDYESMLLLCETGIEARKFDSKSNVWEKSALRTWLNGNFLKGWKDSEKRALLSFAKKGQKMPEKIFILDWGEAAFLFKDDKKRAAQSSDEAAKSKDVIAKARTTGKPPEEKHYVWQWLRDSGLVKGRAAAINPDGVIMFSGIAPDSSGITVRPAVWVKAEAFRSVLPH